MATIPKAIQGGEVMIPLKDETVDDASKDILNKLLKEYKHDLEVIEREAV